MHGHGSAGKRGARAGAPASLLRALALQLFLLQILNVESQAVTRVWRDAQSGSWNDMANWNPSGVPGPLDDVLITVSGTYTVTVDAGASFNTLLLGGADRIQTLNWAAGTVAGALTVPPTGVVNLGLVDATGILSGTVANHGQVIWPAGSREYWYFGNGVLENQPGGLVDVQVDGQFVPWAGTGAIANAGTFRKSQGSGTASFGPTLVFQNTGLVDVVSGTLQLPSEISLAGGRLNLGLKSPSEFGVVAFAETATLTGALSATLIGGFEPAIGDVFAVIAYPSHSGSFSPIELPPLPDTGEWYVEYGTAATTISAVRGAPRLAIARSGDDALLSWPAIADPEYALQSTLVLGPSVAWLPVLDPVQVVGGQRVVRVPVTDDAMFFRLLK